MSTAFSSSERAVLERTVDDKSHALTIETAWGTPQASLCTDWVNKNKFAKVCLQFPDDQLPFSTKICEDLKSSCPEAEFFILADTSYGSCCVDEIAAAHAPADSIIHFGNACQSKVSRLPVLYVFPNYEFDVEKFVQCVSSLKLDDQDVVSKITVFLDAGYHHLIDNDEISLSAKLKEACTSSVQLEKHPSVVGASQSAEDPGLCIFVGRDDQAFFNLSMSVQATEWFLYQPTNPILVKTDPMTTQWIRRRYFYISKCKDAQTIGLIVATLTADGYLDVINRIKEMAHARGKRTHIISVGRINPAKLANFMEIDCFVLIGCPFNNMFTLRDYYKPIVSVFEAEMALNPAWHLKFPETYSLDFKDILPDGKQYQEFHAENIEENDVSLVSGRMMRGRPEIGDEQVNGQESALAERRKNELMESIGTVFDNRTWRGLEQALGRTEPAIVTKGLKGIPTHYTHD